MPKSSGWRGGKLSSSAETVWEAVKHQVLYHSPAVCNDRILCSGEHARTERVTANARRNRKEQKIEDLDTYQEKQNGLLSRRVSGRRKKLTRSFKLRGEKQGIVCIRGNYVRLTASFQQCGQHESESYLRGVFTQLPNTVKAEDDTCGSKNKCTHEVENGIKKQL